MKKFFTYILLALFSSNLFAHIDRAIDALIYEGKQYEVYSQPLKAFLKNNRNLAPKLLPRPINKRIPKHYYATYEIKDNKLYLNKIEIIYISEHSMRYWRFPLALTYELRALPASELFGKDAQYPIFCDWFSGELDSTIFDGDRDSRFLFNDNYKFQIKDGEFQELKEFHTRNIFSQYCSFEESALFGKHITSNDFKWGNALFDLRCIKDLNFLVQEEFDTIAYGKPFKTRGFIYTDDKNRIYLYMPKTRKTKAVLYPLLGRNSYTLGEFKDGDRVEATLMFQKGSYDRAGLLGLRPIDEDIAIHSPDFFLRVKQ